MLTPVTDPRVAECLAGITRLDAQLSTLDTRAHIHEVRALTARRYALAQFLNGQGVPTSPNPITW